MLYLRFILLELLRFKCYIFIKGPKWLHVFSFSMFYRGEGCDLLKQICLFPPKVEPCDNGFKKVTSVIGLFLWLPVYKVKRNDLKRLKSSICYRRGFITLGYCIAKINWICKARIIERYCHPHCFSCPRPLASPRAGAEKHQKRTTKSLRHENCGRKIVNR